MGDVMNQEKVGKIIKELRIKNKLTQKEFAEKFGVTYQAVSKWETGKNLPDINILKAICLEYNILIDEVINGEVIEKQEEKLEVDNEKTKKKYTKNILLGGVLTFFVVVIIGGFIFLGNKEEDFQFSLEVGSRKGLYNHSVASTYAEHLFYQGLVL